MAMAINRLSTGPMAALTNALSLLAVLVAAPATADVYHYVRSDGVQVYSNQPPRPGARPILLSADRDSSAPSAPAAPRGDDRNRISTTATAATAAIATGPGKAFLLGD
jgi:hypothetical protein